MLHFLDLFDHGISPWSFLIMELILRASEEIGILKNASRKFWFMPIEMREERHVYNYYTTTAAAKSLQACPTLCDPIDGSPPGSPVPGILQARTLEWAAISFSNAGKWKVKVKSLSRARLIVTPWTAAHQAPLPMGFYRQKYWSGLPLLSPIQWLRMLKLFTFWL